MLGMLCEPRAIIRVPRMVRVELKWRYVERKAIRGYPVVQ